MRKTAGSEVKIITDRQDQCGESPLWDSSSNTLYWVDITGEKIHTCLWPEKVIHTVSQGLTASALALTESRNLVIAGAKGIHMWNPQQGPIPIAQSFDGQPLPVNDCIVDERGRLLVGTTFFDGTDSYHPGSLYCLGTDHSLRILDSGFRLANGMGFSADGKILYLTDSADRRIYAYRYDAETVAVSSRRTFVQLTMEDGLPDGLTVDAEGFVWSAQWFGGCICRYDPDGVLERKISLPAKQTSSLTFGGPDLTDIFVTSAACPDALSLAPRVYRSSGPTGGPLFHLNLGIQGRQEFRCHLI
jgi:sugar lactone lactonase YvrE